MRIFGFILMLSLAALCAQAEEAGTDTVQALRGELERLKAEQAARAEEMPRLEGRLAALETSAGRADATPAIPPAPLSRLKVWGDGRLRYEGNYGDADASDWDRGSLRSGMLEKMRACGIGSCSTG